MNLRRDYQPLSAAPTKLSAQLVELFGKDLIVGTQGLQHLPDRFEVGALERDARLVGRGDEHRYHDRADLLAFGLADRAADGLNDVDLGSARIDEGHTVKRWHVNTFGKTPRVRE